MIGGVGQYLLIAGHGRVENDLAGADPGGSQGAAGKHAAIFKNEQGGYGQVATSGTGVRKRNGNFRPARDVG